MFKKDITNEELRQFWREVVSNPVGETGNELLPGISGVINLPSVEGHKAVAVRFWSDANREQREIALSRIRSFPLVYSVHEEVTPSKIQSPDN